MRSYALLSLIVIGSRGEQIVDQSIKPLDDEYLPEKITSVTYDSFYNFQNKYNILLLDRFKLTLNLLETPSPNSYNPWTQPTPNNSLFEVIGDSQTWVTGVQTLVIDFFKSKGCKRTWIHSQITFNIISWLVGLPGSFWVVYRIDSQFKNALNQLDNALHSAIDIYFFLFAFLVFRVIIHAFRWLFPLIELDENARSFKARTVLTAILSSLLLALLYDVLKTIF